MKQKLKHITLLSISLILAGGLIVSPSMAADKIIKIGTLFPLTGPCALAGQTLPGIGGHCC